VARRDVTNLTQQLVSTGVEKAQLLQTAAVLATNVGALSGQLATNVVALSEQLATNVVALSEQSTAIREQIERQVRLPANLIYADYLSNRIHVVMSGTTRGGLGQEVVRRSDAGTVLVRQGARVFAVLHLESTPLRLWRC
jgi:hypothetical protein